MGSNRRTGQRPPPNVSAHTQKAKTRPPCLSLYTCAPFYWAEAPPPAANSTPFLCSCAKKRGGAPKKRAFGCRHGSCSVPPASPPNSKPQHHHRLRQADLSAQSTTSPPAKVGRETSRLPTCSAHADGGAAEVKKRFSLAARHRFFGQAPKKWGRKAGQANDHLPTYRRTRTSVKKRWNPRRGFPLRPPPALMRAKREFRALRSAARGFASGLHRL